MDFRIADTFTDSLARLAGDEQKAVKTTVFDLQVNPASPGLRFHKLDKAKDKRFWSVRVNDGIRIIVHRSDSSLMLCFVGHHDDAYGWAERRKIERHPATGAAQLVEIRETVREIEVPRYVDASESAPSAPPSGTATADSVPPSSELEPKRTLGVPLFGGVAEETFLAYGVPLEWLGDVRDATEDTLLGLADHLPREAAEALLELATGGQPAPAPVLEADSDPFTHPDAQRRFRVMTNVEELRRALEFPWERWTVFLHPAQRDLVARRFNGPARVSGTAGTGKTVVAVHRAVHLARTNPESRVLLTTFSPALARFLQRKLGVLLGSEREIHDRIDARPLDEVGLEVFEAAYGAPKLADEATVRRLIEQSAGEREPTRPSAEFLLAEWQDVVDGWQLQSWEAYRVVPRLGRKTRLSESQRRSVWSVCETVRAELSRLGMETRASLLRRATESLALTTPRYSFAIVDECQDLSVAQLRFLAALTPTGGNRLFFAGDLGQRIFQTPFSWKALGVDIRGRSHTLRINYRTSHQIRRQADRLLPDSIADVDGIAESRRGAVSVFNGPEPSVRVFPTEADECGAIADWLRDRLQEGMQPEELGVFVRSDAQLPRAEAAIRQAGLQWMKLDSTNEPPLGCVSLSTMHLAKGLEFRAVAVLAVDDEVVPLQARLEGVSDATELEQAYETERHLLYVACTRARDRLILSATQPGSEFLGDLLEKPRSALR